MRQSYRWAVGPWYDSLFFSGSVVVSLAFLFCYLWAKKFFNLGEAQAIVLFGTIFYMVFDYPHIFQTFSRIYYDKEEFKKRKLAYVGGPLVCIAMGYIVYFYAYFDFFVLGFGLLGSFHIMRQNIGFLKMYKNLGKDYHRFDNLLDIKGYYFMFGFLTFLYFNLPIKGYHYVIQAGWILCAVFLITYLIRQAYLFIKGRANIPKVSVYLSTLTLHFILVMYFGVNPLILTAVETIYHDIQYQGWMMHYQRTFFPTVKNVVGKWLIASFAYGAIAGFFQYEYLIWGGSYILLTTPFIMLVLYHYIIEGFIWKFSKDQRLKRLLPN